MACALPAHGLLAEGEAGGEADKDYGFVDYSPRDAEIVDYQFFELPGIVGLKFRGPEPRLEKGGYFSSIGASQSLGVLIDRPFPSLVSTSAGLPALNLGLGGASPSVFASHDRLLEYVNRGRFAILQVMTARTEENSRLKPTGKIEVLRDLRYGDEVNSIVAWDRIFREEPENFLKYVAESRNSWVAANERLLQKITVPVVLFWFSPRREDAKLDFTAEKGSEVIGDFPQLVDERSLEAIKPLCTRYVACYSERNRYFPFRSRFTGELVSIDYDKNNRGKMGWVEWRNKYYASQEMNDDAVPLLLEATASL